MTMSTLEKLALSKLARKDPPPFNMQTGEEYRMIRVEIDSTTINQPIPDNLVCNEQAPGPDGRIAKDAPYSIPQIYQIYENHLPAVMALLEDASEEDLARVAADLDHHTRECAGTLGDGNEPKNNRHYFPSYPASFVHVMHREMKPFRSVKVMPQPKARAKG